MTTAFPDVTHDGQERSQPQITAYHHLANFEPTPT